MCEKVIRNMIGAVTFHVFELDTDGQVTNERTKHTNKIGMSLLLSQLLPWIIPVIDDTVAIGPDTRCYLLV